MRFFPTVDEDFQYFRSQGYTGSLNDMHYQALGDLGYTGALNDRIRAYLLETFGSYHEALRDLRNGTSVFSLSTPYAVAGFDPALVFDFDDEYYRTSGSVSTFSDSITHSATTNATMVDSDGLLKWRPHNLLTYSEQFDNASWAKSGITTVTADQALSPDGTSTADLIVSSDGTSFSVSKSYNVAGTYTASIWVKDAGRGACAISMGTNTIGYLINVDLTDGSYISGRSYGGGVLIGYSIVSDGDFYKVTVTATASAGGVSVFGGDGISSYDGIYIWGAHLYRSDLGGMVDNPDRGDSYVPTTSSAVYLPRRGHHVYNGSAWVNEGLLHESEERTNLVKYSTPNTTNWTTSNATLTENASVGAGGQTTTSRLSGSGSLQTQRTGINVAITGNAVYSVRLRKDSTHRFVHILQGSDVTFYQNYDLLTSSLGTAGAGVVNAGIEDEGDFWQIFVAFNVVAPSPFYIYLAPSASAFYGQASDTSDYIDIDHVQLEAGLTPSSTIPTSGATVTRAAETLTVPAANLPWPSPVVIGEELVTNGTFDTDSDWTLSANASISAGSLALSGAAFAESVSQNIGYTAGTAVTITVDVTVVSGIVDIWLGGTASFDYQMIRATSSGSYTVSRASWGADGVLYIRSLQVGTTATIDNISVKEINPLSVSIQMQGRMTYADTDTTLEASFVRWGSGFTRIQQTLQTNGVYTGGVNFDQAAPSVVTGVVSGLTTYSPGVNVPYNISSRHGSTFINGAVDGVALTANTTPVALPDLSATDLVLGYDYMGTIKLFRMWSDDLADAGIAEASEPSLEPSLSLTFDGSETSFTVSDWSA